ncbi:MAG: DUF4442 domain-containing protein [Saprospiraceae bacterium]|nr:DUF4442 domain-containing protein [Saprospiraceae bacterium]
MRDPQSFGPATKKYLRDVNIPWKMRLYFLTKLPSMFWWKARVMGLSPQACIVRLPYSWRTKNPFHSTYFAAQCAVAELSTGLLATLALQDKPSVSMLVTDVHTVFFKKADAATFFTCQQGQEVAALVEKAVSTGEAQTITMKSIGTKADGTIVSETHLTWSFKLRQQKN